MSRSYDAVIVGSGPNGLSAAILLASEGLSTLVIEAHDTAGGGMRSSRTLTLPGFTHDVCSSVHPLGLASPWFRELQLEREGLRWLESPAPIAHLMNDGSAVVLEQSLARTAEQLGRDGPAYRRLFAPFVEQFDRLLPMILAPLRFPADPFLMARFGLRAIRSMRGLARSLFVQPRAGALLAGIAAHAMIPLDQLITSSFALVLGTAGHAVGWPIARGGSQGIADALLARFASLGGELQLGQPITDFAQLPPARAYLFDTGPHALLKIAGERLPSRYRRRAARFRYGPGVFKVDWALRGPVPWRDPSCRRAVTIHLAGDLEQVHAAEAAANAGRLSEQPFVLFGQPSLVDDSRAPAGMHTAWAYCHVPHGSELDALPQIEALIERHAPGFRDLVLARATRNAREMEQYNPNCVGGDINTGISDWSQLFFRPILRLDPYATPNPQIYLCSSSTPPGGGVHGMCGYWAARSALAHSFGRRVPGPVRVPAAPLPRERVMPPHAPS
jgi:phytoene dehydrogenase-like protein